MAQVMSLQNLIGQATQHVYEGLPGPTKATTTPTKLGECHKLADVPFSVPAADESRDGDGYRQ